MRITLDHRRPSPSHCTVAVFVNGALAGELMLRQEEVGSFNQIFQYGLALPGDIFKSTGDSNPPAPQETPR